MKAVRFHDYGDPGVLQLEDVPPPELRDDDVLVHVYAAGVNPIDWKVREGRLHEMIQHRLPLIPGWDFSGVVEKGGRGWSAGDEVFGKADVARDGCYAELLAVRAREVAHKPVRIDHVHAAAVPTAALTAWQALFGFDGKPSLELERDQSILILGAAGGVGSFAVQLAKWRGATVYATAREQHRRYLTELGADVVIDYEHEDIADIESVDAVLDLVGGEPEETASAVLRAGGVLASTVHPLSDDVARRFDIRGITVGARMDREQLERIGHLIDEGLLRVPVTEVMPLDQARRAHEISESHHAEGKIVLRIV